MTYVCLPEIAILYFESVVKLPIKLDHYTLLQTENEAVQQRLANVPIRQDARLHDHVVDAIQSVMENQNPFAAAFKYMYEVKLEEHR